ncbi:TPA: hypothetical protein QFK61_002065 [Enterococcus faecium]
MKNFSTKEAKKYIRKNKKVIKRNGLSVQVSRDGIIKFIYNDNGNAYIDSLTSNFNGYVDKFEEIVFRNTARYIYIDV